MENTNEVSVQETAKREKFAIAGFVLGLVGLVAWLIPILGIADGIVGIVLSVKGLKTSKRVFAIIGLVLSIAAIIGAIIYWIITTAAVLAALSL